MTDEDNSNEDVSSHLVDFLRDSSALLLNLSGGGVQHIEEALNSEEVREVLVRFATQDDQAVLYAEHVDTGDMERVCYTLRVGHTGSPAYHEVRARAAFVKCREGILSTEMPMTKQLHLITLSGSDTTLLATMQMYTRQAFTPLVRAASSTQQGASSGGGAVGNTSADGLSATGGIDESEGLSTNSMKTLLKRLRELDLALEDCQVGSSVTKVDIPYPAAFENVSGGGTDLVSKLQSCLEKFNPSSADGLFDELGLTQLTSANSEESEAFASEVNAQAKTWPAEMARQIKLIETPFPGRVHRELRFWADIQENLLDTKNKLATVPVLLTKLVLKRTNRVSEQLLKEAESELEKALDVAAVANSFLKDFPFDGVMSAASLYPHLSTGIKDCLQHFSKIRYSKYELTRAVKLMEAMGESFHEKLIALLKERDILLLPIKEFRSVKRDADEVFVSWDANYAQQLTLLSDVAKRRRVKMSRLTFRHTAARQHLQRVSDFREQHEKLLSVFSKVFATDDSRDILGDLADAYKVVLRTVTDVMDSGPEGQKSWESARQMYEKKLERTEERITVMLDDQLSSATSAEAMFRVFGNFNPLFFRPMIRNAVNSYRNTLMKNVREDVKRLQEKFRFRYEESQEKAMADLRDIPPLSGRIIWARQIGSQLSRLMKRMEDVLGVGWESHSEGKQLKEVCDELRSYLDTDQLFKVWKEKLLRSDDTKRYAKYKDFVLLTQEDAGSGMLSLKVNFDEKQTVLVNEVRHLDWLLPGMSTTTSIPATIKSLAKEAQMRYPIAVALQAGLATFYRAKEGLHEENTKLLVTYIEPIREMVKEAIGGSRASKRWIKWEAANLRDWVQTFSSRIIDFQDRVSDLTEKMSKVDQLLAQLKSCPYVRDDMEGALVRLQGVVDDMQMRGFSNLVLWVSELDKKIESIVCGRLVGAVKAWVTAFQTCGDDSNPEDSVIFLDQSVHEILLTNQVLYLSPPLEQARVDWVACFQNHISILCSLPRVVSARYQVFAEESDAARDYTNVVKQMDTSLLVSPFTAIEDQLKKMKLYVNGWLQYQALWDVEVSLIADKIGTNLGEWQQLLQEIKSSRAKIDTVTEEVSFGPILVSHRQIQSKINIKYDSWQKDLQARFGAIVFDSAVKLHSDLLAWRTKLEGVVLEGSTEDAIQGVQFVLEIEANGGEVAATVANLEASERLLRKQRYNFPEDWMSTSNVCSLHNDFLQVLGRRQASMKANYAVLKNKFTEEDTRLSCEVDAFLKQWAAEGSIAGTTPPPQVLEKLSQFSTQVTRLLNERSRIESAKKALGLPKTDGLRLSEAHLDIQGIEESWDAVLPVWTELEIMRALKIADVSPPKMRKQLEGAMDLMKKVPPKYKSYTAYMGMQERLAKYQGVQPIVKDLCSDAFKERHWRTLLKSMHTSGEITVGLLWDADLASHKKTIADMLSMAQGELALEQFFKDVKDHWVDTDLQLVMRDNVYLVVGWDVLLTVLDDNLNSLASLKQSPYFGNVQEFQDDARSWDTKLGTLRFIFERWIEVQRKWVYLRGIFKSPDIKAQLPTQTSKFRSVDKELTGLTKGVASRPGVLDLLQMENLPRLLERHDNSMTVIQKALGEYLERQRQAFARFYFVNNDDLLEIIGNSNEPKRVFAHLSKMFSALKDLATTQDGGTGKLTATTMRSRDNEEVAFKTSVDLSINVKDWLTQVSQTMATTLASALGQTVEELSTQGEALSVDWLDKQPAQVAIIAVQAQWTAKCELALAASKTRKKDKETLAGVEAQTLSRLAALSSSVLEDLAPALRKKCEQVITEVVHQRDVTRSLITKDVSDANNFDWLYHLRFYLDPVAAATDIFKKLCIRICNASFFYGFEYLGIGERLVQTPLTDRCYMTLTQALHFRMGGNPFGPAGTGKTESVKMLGAQLGRFVLVFNCDENFDYAAMGRIFAGLCQVGAWGCFDEFNRLEERILSAVSQQIQTIQRGLLGHADKVDLLGNTYSLSTDVGIFVTMNPGYAGRSELPDNLKRLFRAVAMSAPDRKMIAEVMLFSQGITTAEDLAGKIVLLFTLCEEQLSRQSHYDFGLRSLKSVLSGAGELKRAVIAKHAAEPSSNPNANPNSLATVEMSVLIKSASNSVVPKLTPDDIVLFRAQLKAVFPQADDSAADDPVLLQVLHDVCKENSLEASPAWTEKISQLKNVLDMRHGVMMVGPSSSGKTTAWRTLFAVLNRLEGCKGEFHVIDPKAISKDELYGTLDPNTLEWTDGIFTKVLRKASDTNTARSSVKRHWIIFDGDVDPEWAENLNSVLDDNKVLTLPTGDRIQLNSATRIMMEVDSLRHATLATVSRCGMVWFAQDTVTESMMFSQLLRRLVKEPLPSVGVFGSDVTSASRVVKAKFVETISSYFVSSRDHEGLVSRALSFALSRPHIMDVSIGRLFSTLIPLLHRGIATAVEYDTNVVPLSEEAMYGFASKWLLFSVLWAFGASMGNVDRYALADLLLEASGVDVPPGTRLTDLHVDIESSGWVEWVSMVPSEDIDPHQVQGSDVVITTADTLRHVELMKGWLASHQPIILCGPPGSGKTMTLTSVLESSSDFILALLNFSSATTPDQILKTFAQFCELREGSDGLTLQPSRQTYSESKWLVVFCDEVNLPEKDKYGTQRVISFLRQLTEQRGYWNAQGKWVTLQRIQFVSACNPPTDAGRVHLSERYLRHTALLHVDYPEEESLKRIYRAFNHGLLKLHPNLRGSVDSLTDAMVEFYTLNQERFTPHLAPQYIYSPRELSRWVRALYEAAEPLDSMTLEEMVRLWCHEGLRLFHDRLMTDAEKSWCEETIDDVASRHFAQVDLDKALQRPMLYSNWTSKHYSPIGRDELRDFVAARLRVFYEEELDVPLVVFDDVLEHVLRIDNVMRHPMGHMLLVGDSGVGKTVLTRFVAWMNGLTVFQIKASNKYTIQNFDDDLRVLLRRVGVEGEKVCFIFDEGNALSSAFLERINALLASGEIPGLFEGDDAVQLLSACRESYKNLAGSTGASMMDSDDDLWRTFTREVQRNLHVVFTMNPASADFKNRCVTSPALFNRCVVDWFGTWGYKALVQVGEDFTSSLDVGFTTYVAENPPESLTSVIEMLDVEGVTLHHAVVAALVTMHEAVKYLTQSDGRSGRPHYLSPRDFLDCINKFVRVQSDRREHLEDQQTHIRAGLEKLQETQHQVDTLATELAAKEEVLKTKDAEANLKLTQMVEKQNEAEQKKSTAEALSKELTEQKETVRVRKGSVEAELSEAEPALIAAKQCVQNIRKQQLDEVRQLANPPAAVRMTMEMVNIMMGEKSLEWIDIRKVIRRDDFISTVVNFDPMTLSEEQTNRVLKKYLEKPGFSYEAVDRASKACSPLFQWAQSQIQFATILTRVKPLRDEVSSLEAKMEEVVARQEEAMSRVTELEDTITVYKEEYANAIRATETIRAEMQSVTQKVARAEELLTSLGQEKQRWSTSSATFDDQMNTLIGDSLLCAAFLTYGGIFGHKNRKLLISEWSLGLESLSIPYRKDMDMIGFLSKPSEQMVWRGFGLPSDDLAAENAILLERYNRFPLIIDPSDRAVAFIMNKYASRKIVKTSLLDAGFMKTLASAIRFGNPLMVTEVEGVDPILNPLLNKEVHRTGGRTLITLGSEEIDFSPKFELFLSTRDPLAHFAPDLCSRVTLVNFTVTPASLEAQLLSAILKSERPDVDRKRTEVLRLQGEQAAKMRELEDTLLDKIADVQGAILDDDSILRSLETIKAEAKDLNVEAAKTEDIMEDMRRISSVYEPLAVAMSSVYFQLEALCGTNNLYQYNLLFFLELCSEVLRRVHKDVTVDTTESDTAVTERLQQVGHAFYKEISRRILRGLVADDKLMFMFKLCKIATAGDPAAGLTPVEEDWLFRGGAAGAAVEGVSPTMLAKAKEAIPSSPLPDTDSRALLSLSLLPSFSNLLPSMSDDWAAILTHATPEEVIPSGWAPVDTTDVKISLLEIMIVRVLRPDRVIPAVERYVARVFGGAFKWRELCNIDLGTVVDKDTTAQIPIMVCSEHGHDASPDVDALAASRGKELMLVAMGSAEGYVAADRCISQASKTGAWVMLKNVHLCTDWLRALEKRLHGVGATSHDNFRLFLAGDITPGLPTELLRISEVVAYERSTGIKPVIQRFLGSVPVERFDAQPLERSRLYALLAWFHAVVLERLRYSPVGWSSKYEFSDGDAMCAIDTLDEWVGTATTSRGKLDPAAIPWKAIRTLLSESIYGGRIDNEFDQAALDSFIAKIFTEDQYNSGAVLAEDYSPASAGCTKTDLVVLTDGYCKKVFEEWCAGLPDTASPNVLGLPATAEKRLRSEQGLELLTKAGSTYGSGHFGAAEGGASGDALGSEDPSARLDAVADTIILWRDALPSIDSLPDASAVVYSPETPPFTRGLAREVRRGKELLQAVHHDLSTTLCFCRNELKATNVTMSNVTCIFTGKTPPQWTTAYNSSTDGCAAWISEFAAKIKSLSRYISIIQNGAVCNAAKYWLGGLFQPEAFITATRQSVAESKGWSIEDLEMHVCIGKASVARDGGEFLVEGLLIEGATAVGSAIDVAPQLRSSLPVSVLAWIPRQEVPVDTIAVPMYTTDKRDHLAARVYVTVPSSMPRHVWAQRGVALLVSSPGYRPETL